MKTQHSFDSFDIFNDKERQIKCISNKKTVHDCIMDKPTIYDTDIIKKLKIGQIYTVIEVDVDSWFTTIRLKEFPKDWFNSVHFSEID